MENGEWGKTGEYFRTYDSTKIECKLQTDGASAMSDAGRAETQRTGGFRWGNIPCPSWRRLLFAEKHN
jgi:hypothetical protein